MGNQRKWFIIYGILSGLYLTGILLHLSFFEFYGKPLLLLPLMRTVWIAENAGVQKMLFFALLCSWCGDILLLGAADHSSYFILGLIAFLIAHVFLIMYFLRRLKQQGVALQWEFSFLGLLALYLALLLRILIPHLGSLSPEVVIYALTLSTMLYMARQLSLQLRGLARAFLLSGAISFVISDSLLAINKFYHPITFASFLIMGTYLYAQFGIVRGCLDTPLGPQAGNEENQISFS